MAVVASSKTLVLTLFTPSSDVAPCGWVLWGERSWGITSPLQGDCTERKKGMGVRVMGLQGL